MSKRLDQSFIDSMRERIEVLQILDKFQACILENKQLTKEQLLAGKTLLAKVMPDLKAVEHSGEINRPNKTREELLERIANLQSGKSAGFERQPAPGTGGEPGTAEVRH